jgi:hypothetical protein
MPTKYYPETQRQYRHDNKEKIKKTLSDYYERNKEELKRKRNERYQKNKLLAKDEIQRVLQA